MKPRPVGSALFLSLADMVLAGCATGGGEAKSAEPAQPVPADSAFAKVNLGMGDTQATDILGQPNDRRVFTTGKSWIPFYYGSDTVNTMYYYKGEGRIVFNGKRRLNKIVYDPTEDGYK
ncbi:MAG: hypothetical protein GY851_28735 [bacterium]|nr:hypothetical protein [bacterium]